MRTLIYVVIMITLSFNSFAMRCGTHLINEGDSVVRMIAVCGQPTQAGMNMIYLDKDGDGMNYYIHADSNGMIDDIQFSKD